MNNMNEVLSVARNARHEGAKDSKWVLYGAQPPLLPALPPPERASNTGPGFSKLLISHL